MKYKQVKLVGSMVFSAPQAKQKIKKIEDEKFVELDLSGVDFMDSTGVDVITQLRNKIWLKGGTLRVINTKQDIRDVLEVCGIDVIS